LCGRWSGNELCFRLRGERRESREPHWQNRKRGSRQPGGQKRDDEMRELLPRKTLHIKKPGREPGGAGGKRGKTTAPPAQKEETKDRWKVSGPVQFFLLEKKKSRQRKK